MLKSDEEATSSQNPGADNITAGFSVRSTRHRYAIMNSAAKSGRWKKYLTAGTEEVCHCQEQSVFWCWKRNQFPVTLRQVTGSIDSWMHPTENRWNLDGSAGWISMQCINCAQYRTQRTVCCDVNKDWLDKYIILTSLTVCQNYCSRLGTFVRWISRKLLTATYSRTVACQPRHRQALRNRTDHLYTGVRCTMYMYYVHWERAVPVTGTCHPSRRSRVRTMLSPVLINIEL